MLYGARNQVGILAADLRTDDRRAADQARARAAATDPAGRPSSQPEVEDRPATAWPTKPAPAPSSAPAGRWPRFLGRPAGRPAR